VSRDPREEERAGAAIPHPQPPLSGEGFVLRPFRAADFAPARAALEQRRDEARWVEALPGTDGESTERAFEDGRLAGELLQLVIAEPDGEAYIGELCVVLLEPGVAELGCMLVPEARGRGIATRALRAATTWALATLALRRAQVMVDPRNGAALRIAEQAGFRREGLLRACWEVDGEVMDALLLSRLPGDDAPPRS
jgi:RimJ/RimL family protein N-acetyltransferase